MDWSGLSKLQGYTITHANPNSTDITNKLKTNGLQQVALLLLPVEADYNCHLNVFKKSILLCSQQDRQSDKKANEKRAHV